jgi:hypothetical protein
MAVYTDADLQRIKSAIASGVRSVTFADGRKTEYQNLDQMLAAKRVIEAEVQMAARSAGTIVRRRVPYYKSGL